MKTQKTVTLTNSFHNTEITVRAPSVALLDKYACELSKSQRATVRRIRARLCGAKDCVCGVVR